MSLRVKPCAGVKANRRQRQKKKGRSYFSIGTCILCVYREARKQTSVSFFCCIPLKLSREKRREKSLSSALYCRNELFWYAMLTNTLTRNRQASLCASTNALSWIFFFSPSSHSQHSFLPCCSPSACFSRSENSRNGGDASNRHSNNVFCLDTSIHNNVLVLQFSFFLVSNQISFSRFSLIRLRSLFVVLF